MKLFHEALSKDLYSSAPLVMNVAGTLLMFRFELWQASSEYKFESTFAWAMKKVRIHMTRNVLISGTELISS